MTTTTCNIGLGIALIVTLGLNWRLPHDTGLPNTETILPDMAHSVAYDYFSPNSVLPNGLTMQPPVAGTVPYQSPGFLYGASLEERTRAGLELHSPLEAADPLMLERGKVIFERSCALCHGLGGNADGPVVQRGYPAPKSLVIGELPLLRDGEMYHVVTMGFKNMPSQAYQVASDDRWAAIAYIRTLQQTAAIPLITSPTETSAGTPITATSITPIPAAAATAGEAAP